MRKLLTFIAALFITGSMFAGGLVTNTNQSATWVRLPSRNASVGIDAAYFNPAGLMKLENGFHVSLSNQSIWQTRKVTNNYSGPDGNTGLNTHVFEGTVTAPLFPSFSAVYKMDKVAFNLGFYPVGGGGGAVYEQGLPSFEMSPSDLVPSLASKVPGGVGGYRLDAYFKGSSIFFGFQGGVSYKINDIISVAFGLRYVTAKNTYEGHLSDIQLNVGGSWAPATTVLDGLSNQILGFVTQISPIPTKLAPVIAANAGSMTLAQLVGAGMMLPADKTGIEAALTALGVPTTSLPLMNVSTISATVKNGIASLNDQKAGVDANSSLLGNQSADVAQTGSGFTPVLSVNISPSEKLNIAIKYEFMTKLELTNKTVQDLTVGYGTKAGSVPSALIPDMTKPVTMFPNGAKLRNDMPAMLTIGVDYKVTSALLVSLGMNYYWDKSANYGHKINGAEVPNKDIFDDNGFSVQGGVQYNISKKLLVSGGYVWANKGANSKYQSDLTYGLGTMTYGVGGAYNFTDKIQLNLGASTTIYRKDSKIVNHVFSSTGESLITYESYEKNTFLVGIGLDISF